MREVMSKECNSTILSPYLAKATLSPIVSKSLRQPAKKCTTIIFFIIKLHKNEAIPTLYV